VLVTAQQFIQGTAERQALIAAIEKITRRRLLVYHAPTQHQAGILTGTDLNLVMDLCDDLGSRRVPADLMIHTPGGDANAAEMILNAIHQRASSVRVIVPREAKSAGTLLAMGAEEIVMGIASELGPVDPQIPVIVGGRRAFAGQVLPDGSGFPTNRSYVEFPF
jgi:Serine dehydrogenase proteinase